MNHSDSIAQLAPALVAAQAELRSVVKDGANPHFKSRYATLDAIIEEIRPVLARHSLALMQGALGSNGGYLDVETMLIHASGEWISGGISLPMGKADPQGAGAAMTYGRRFGLSALLSLATEDDDDGNAASKPTRRAASQSDPRGSSPARGSSATKQTGESTPAPKPDLFFGKPRGTPLGEYDDASLIEIINWCKNKKDSKQPEKLKQTIDTARAILADRSLGQPTTDAQRDAVAVSRLADKPDDLPF